MTILDAASALLLADAVLMLLAGTGLRLHLALQGMLLLAATAISPLTPGTLLSAAALLGGQVLVVPWLAGRPPPPPRSDTAWRGATMIATILVATLAAGAIRPGERALAAPLLAALAVGIAGAAFAEGSLQTAALATSQNAALLGIIALDGPSPVLALLALLSAALTAARLQPRSAEPGP